MRQSFTNCLITKLEMPGFVNQHYAKTKTRTYTPLEKIGRISDSKRVKLLKALAMTNNAKINLCLTIFS